MAAAPRQPPPTPVPAGSIPSAPFLIVQPGNVFLIDLAVVPNAKRTEAVGLHDQTLRVRLSAPPVDGAANEALVRWLADALGVPRNHVELLRGASGRRKRLRVDATPQQMAAWLAALDAAGVLSG